MSRRDGVEWPADPRAAKAQAYVERAMTDGTRIFHVEPMVEAGIGTAEEVEAAMDLGVEAGALEKCWSIYDMHGECIWGSVTKPVLAATVHNHAREDEEASEDVDDYTMSFHYASIAPQSKCAGCRRMTRTASMPCGRCAACDTTFEAGRASAIEEAVSIMLGAAMVAPIEHEPHGDDSWSAERVAQMMRTLVKP